MARITVEDCLEVVPSRFELVHVASQRARRLIKGARPLIKTDNKLVVTSLREVAAGLVKVDDGSEPPKVPAAETAPAIEAKEAAPAAEAAPEAASE